MILFYINYGSRSERNLLSTSNLAANSGTGQMQAHPTNPSCYACPHYCPIFTSWLRLFLLHIPLLNLLSDNGVEKLKLVCSNVLLSILPSSAYPIHHPHHRLVLIISPSIEYNRFLTKKYLL